MAPLLGGHSVVGQLLALQFVPLGRKDPEAEGFQLLRQPIKADQPGRTNIPETQASCAIGIPKRALDICASGAYGRAKPACLTGNPIVVKRP